MTKRSYWHTSGLALVIALSLNVAQARAQSVESKDVNSSAMNGSDGSGDEIQLSKLLPQPRPKSRPFFSLMPENRNPNLTGSTFSIAPTAAAPPVTGSGTLGRLTKWSGFTSSNSAIVDSNIYEDKFGKVGIGTDSPTSKLTVAGMIEAKGTDGGVKFPDGTVQTTSASNALLTVVHDQTMTGDGSAASPLTVVSQDALIDPFAAHHFEVADNQFLDFSLATVPVGKRLVIEHVSGACATSGLATITIITTSSAGASFVPHRILTVPGVNGFSSFSQALKLYAHSGTQVRFTFNLGPTTSRIPCDAQLSGYMVNLPSGDQSRPN